jgi:hypothetical protein
LGKLPPFGNLSTAELALGTAELVLQSPPLERV